MDALLEWNRKTSNNKTYANFKKHMRTAYHALNEVGALTIQDSSINQVNLIQEISSQQEKMAQDIKDSLQSNILEAMMMMQTPSTDTPYLIEDSSSISANTFESAKSTATIESLVSIIKNLESKMEKLQKGYAPSNNGDSDTINPKTGKEWKRYCWTCGCCPHASKDCPIKKPGHQVKATFNNRLGGSNEKCYPLKK